MNVSHQPMVVSMGVQHNSQHWTQHEWSGKNVLKY